MKLKIEFTKNELARFSEKFQNAAGKLQNDTIDGFYQAAHAVQSHALTRAPRDTGALAKSAAMVSAAPDNAADIRAAIISFGADNLNPKTGRPTKSYAIYNHEILHESHPDSYKWLARALREFGEEQFAEEIAQALAARGWSN